MIRANLIGFLVVEGSYLTAWIFPNQVLVKVGQTIKHKQPFTMFWLMAVHMFGYSSKAWSTPFKMAATAKQPWQTNGYNSSIVTKFSVVIDESHQQSSATQHRGFGYFE